MTAGEVPFDEFMSPVSFGCFAYDEGLERARRVFEARENPDARGNWIGAHSQTANTVDPNSEILGDSLDKFPADPTNKNRSFRILSRLLRVNVQIALCTRSQRECTVTNGFCLENFQQLLFRIQCLHINRM